MRKAGYTRAAIRDLRKIPRKDAQRIMGKVTQYAEKPDTLANNIRALENMDGKRLRVGEYRILFTEDETSVEVYRVRKRGEAYR